MKIFVYYNRKHNYCHGDYYFIAASKEYADTMANAFAKKHNNKVNDNYKIKWDPDVKEYEIKPGYLPLNR